MDIGIILYLSNTGVSISMKLLIDVKQQQQMSELPGQEKIFPVLQLMEKEALLPDKTCKDH